MVVRNQSGKENGAGRGGCANLYLIYSEYQIGGGDWDIFWILFLPWKQ
jgi:hypothetical protein